jgi:cytochrome c oxidase accessory protein FixG
MRGEPRGPRKRGLGSVLERGRGLLDKVLAYDYVFRAAHHPSAADAAVHARGNTAIADIGLQAAPLPSFSADQLGDCIDCTICVQVCPTGIDIRNGLQYECIACGACIDACDEVMDKMGYPRGLIRYSTQNAIDGKSTRILRPRIVVYGLLLLALCLGWAWGVTHRSPVIAEVLRDRNALYRERADDRIENGYTVKIVNKTVEPRRYRIALEGGDDIALAGGAIEVAAAAEEVVEVPVILAADDDVHGKHAVTFIVDTVGDPEARKRIESSFFGPLE